MNVLVEDSADGGKLLKPDFQVIYGNFEALTCKYRKPYLGPNPTAYNIDFAWAVLS